MLISFSPTKDPAARALVSLAVADVILNRKELFFQGGLSIAVTSAIVLPPEMMFSLTLLTLTSYGQLRLPPTLMGQGEGAADYLQSVLDHAPVGPANG